MSHSTAQPSGSRSPFGERAFVLLVSYTAPLTRIEALLGEHRAWLDEHFADGTFLVSGPQVPRTGGAILASAASRRQIDDVVATDPFVLAGVASYQIVEFTPTRGPYAASASPAPAVQPAPPAAATVPSPPAMSFIRSREFTADRAWGALPVAEMNGITTRLHWTDQPYRWHVNDGQEVFVVLDGRVEMRHRENGAELVTVLEAGDIVVAAIGTEHAASPLGEARVLVVESAGSI